MIGPWLELDITSEKVRLSRLNRNVPVESVIGIQGLHGEWRSPGRRRYVSELNLLIRSATGETERLPVVATHDPQPVESLGKSLAKAMGVPFAMHDSVESTS